MKKLKEILASGLSLLFVFGAAACGDNGNSGKDSSEQESIKTNEEIFAEVKAADANSRAYEGAYTIEQTYTTKAQNRIEKTEIISSGDVKNRKFVEKAYKIDENGERQPNHEAKWFQSEGEECWYYSDYEERTEAYRNVIKDYCLNIALGGMPCEALDSMVSFTLADSFAELTQSYQTVTENSVQALQAKHPVANGTTFVTAEDVNGISVVRIDSQAEICKNDQTPASCSSSFFLAVKGGRIYKIYIKTEMTWEMQGVPVHQCLEYEFVYTYAFHEALYNSVIPCEIGESPQKEEVRIEFVYHDDFYSGGYTTFDETATAQELFSRVKSSAFSGMGYAYTVEGWYLDEARTQRLDVETIEGRELLEIEKLYAKDFTVAGVWAVIAMKGETENRLSKQYKIVEKNGLYATSQRDYPLRCVSVRDGQQTWGIADAAGDCDEIYFDGVLTTTENVVLEGGRLYTAKFIDFYEDKDYNLFSALYTI